MARPRLAGKCAVCRRKKKRCDGSQMGCRKQKAAAATKKKQPMAIKHNNRLKPITGTNSVAKVLAQKECKKERTVCKTSSKGGSRGCKSGTIRIILNSHGATCPSPEPKPRRSWRKRSSVPSTTSNTTELDNCDNDDCDSSALGPIKSEDSILETLSTSSNTSRQNNNSSDVSSLDLLTWMASEDDEIYTEDGDSNYDFYPISPTKLQNVMESKLTMATTSMPTSTLTRTMNEIKQCVQVANQFFPSTDMSPSSDSFSSLTPDIFSPESPMYLNQQTGFFESSSLKYVPPPQGVSPQLFQTNAISSATQADHYQHRSSEILGEPYQALPEYSSWHSDLDKQSFTSCSLWPWSEFSFHTANIARLSNELGIDTPIYDADGPDHLYNSSPNSVYTSDLVLEDAGLMQDYAYGSIDLQLLLNPNIMNYGPDSALTS